MRIRLLASAALVLALAGCTTPAPEAPMPTPTLTPAPSTILNPDLVPMSLGVVTEQNAAAEGNRIGDALEALIEPGSIVNISDASQLAPAADDLPPYYVVYRTYTLDPAVDALTLSQTIVAIMLQSGWTSYDETNEGGQYLAALSGGPADAPWFALIGGDASVEGQSVVTFQIASPDVTA
jgi:hypothetical protein